MAGAEEDEDQHSDASTDFSDESDSLASPVRTRLGDVSRKRIQAHGHTLNPLFNEEEEEGAKRKLAYEEGTAKREASSAMQRNERGTNAAWAATPIDIQSTDFSGESDGERGQDGDDEEGGGIWERLRMHLNRINEVFLPDSLRPKGSKVPRRGSDGAGLGVRRGLSELGS